MAKTKTSGKNTPQRRPALTPEARENQLIAMAYDLVEQRLLDGTASSQETTHFLKLASSKALLEKEKLAEENKLLRARTEAIQEERKSAEFYSQVLDALKLYSGQSSQSDEYDEYDGYDDY